ncbi:MAG: hypothetical protein EA366_12350 [Spirulina sp. DLM2.Bin59]|nr:MAG: hypothetical protein EA366_12350 [Spirulina sp. DLM2.Bin59]
MVGAIAATFSLGFSPTALANEMLEPIAVMTDWVSPRLKIRFGWDETGLTLYYPDGQRFLTSIELHRRAVDAEAALAQERARAEQAEADLAALQAKLAALGIDPQDVK